MLQSLLVSASPDPEWIATSEPEVKAVVFQVNGGLLVLPMWLGKGAQCVPGQSAKVNLQMTVPHTPVGTQPWQVGPGMVRSLRPERVPGGTQITIPEFGLTAAVVFTSDNGPNGVLVHFQDLVKQNAKTAAELAKDLALESKRKTAFVYDKLVQAGHPLPDGSRLMDKAQSLLKSADDYYSHGQYQEAYADADRALRPLRIIMREEWNLACKELPAPVSSPLCDELFLLAPQHWQLMDGLEEAIIRRRTCFRAATSSNHRRNPHRTGPGKTPSWIASTSSTSWRDPPPSGPSTASWCMMLQVQAKNKELPPVSLERCFLAVRSPNVIQPPGTWVKISGWVRIPKAITASVDGALFYDSAAGEPLAVRMTEACPSWKQLVLYRKVPPSRPNQRDPGAHRSRFRVFRRRAHRACRRRACCEAITADYG